jgi:hypothetical protein
VSGLPTTRPESFHGSGISSGRPRGLGSTRLVRMRIELDHLFVCTAPGAPEAEELVRFGLREEPPNRHPGQGTANRRFAFANTMIEFVALGERCKSSSKNFVHQPTLPRVHGADPVVIVQVHKFFRSMRHDGCVGSILPHDRAVVSNTRSKTERWLVVRFLQSWRFDTARLWFETDSIRLFIGNSPTKNQKAGECSRWEHRRRSARQTAK